MNGLSNLEITTSLPLNKANDQTKVNENCFIELTHLLIYLSLSSLTCQILSFESGKISLGKRFNDMSLSKTLIQTRERNACGRKKRAPIILLS